KRLNPDPERIYLTGHSMGGHGTWQVGATYPDRFAALGPSAGWISFFSYAGGRRVENPSPVEAMLQRATNPSDTLALARNYLMHGVYILHGDADDNVPVTQARTMAEHLKGFHRNVTVHEQPGAGHWWDASEEPGADAVDWQPMFDFFARHARPTDGRLREIDFTTASPGVSAWCYWAGIEAQVHPLKFSNVKIRFDPHRRRFTGTTENVARLALSMEHVPEGGWVAVELDGHVVEKAWYPGIPLRRLHFSRTGGKWTPAPPNSALKGPHRYGPFADAFRNRVLFVYGTKGDPEENAWALAKARYDAEQFGYRGNGSVDVIPDTAYRAELMKGRNAVLYGNAETNGAWAELLGESPVQVRRGVVRVGGREARGGDLACLFLRPLPGSDTALVGAVSGTHRHRWDAADEPAPVLHLRGPLPRCDGDRAGDAGAGQRGYPHDRLLRDRLGNGERGVRVEGVKRFTCPALPSRAAVDPGREPVVRHRKESTRFGASGSDVERLEERRI
ncbi:MAG: prolyl oligopeptidase family serine peptidase, partial [Armatimonadetes bacterium]|nr:prolyl oligopeptidase family serine peptidase [Armatimonadota bacterium]